MGQLIGPSTRSPVLRDQLFVEPDGRGGVRAVVVEHQLELRPSTPPFSFTSLTRAGSHGAGPAPGPHRSRSWTPTRLSEWAAAPPRPPTSAPRGLRPRRASGCCSRALTPRQGREARLHRRSLCFSVTSATASVIGRMTGRGPSHLVPGDEPLVDGDRRGGIRLIVLHEQLDPAAQDAALLVRVLDAEPVTAELVLAQGGERSGLGERRADAERCCASARVPALTDSPAATTAAMTAAALLIASIPSRSTLTPRRRGEAASPAPARRAKITFTLLFPVHRSLHLSRQG